MGVTPDIGDSLYRDSYGAVYKCHIILDNAMA